MERLSAAVGRGRLWRYQCAQVTTRQSLETRHRAIQQVIKDEQYLILHSVANFCPSFCEINLHRPQTFPTC